MRIQYKLHEEKYKSQVVRLLQKGLSVNFTERRFNWLHLQNPLAPSEILLALDGEKVIGFRAAIKKHIMIGNKIYISGRDIDSTLDPAYRGKGIFSEMIKLSLEIFNDIDIYFNFNNRLASPVYMKKGWKSLTYGNMSFCISQPSFSKLYLASIYSEILLKNFRMNSLVKEIKFEEFNFSKNTFKSEFPISVKKDEEYLKWRYCGNPDRKYRYFNVRTEQKKNAMVICRFKKEHCIIIDILNQAELSNSDILKNLFSYFKEKNYKLRISAWSQTALNINKFMFCLPKRELPVFYVRGAPGKKFDIDVHSTKNWFMVPGESEFM